MSVEQTTQLIQLILNSVLMSVACALVLGGLTARYAAIGSQIQAFSRSGETNAHTALREAGSHETASEAWGYSRSALQHLKYRYTLSRCTVLAGYYALFFSILSCFVLTLRGLLNWNGLIPVALGCFVFGVATLLLALVLTLVDWHLSDRALLEEAQQLFSLGHEAKLPRSRSRTRRSRAKRRTSLAQQLRQKMRAG